MSTSVALVTFFTLITLISLRKNEIKNSGGLVSGIGNRCFITLGYRANCNCSSCTRNTLNTLFALRTYLTFRTHFTRITFISLRTLLALITFISLRNSDIKNSSLRSSTICNSSICTSFSCGYSANSNCTGVTLRTLLSDLAFFALIAFITFISLRNSNVDKTSTLSFIKFYSSSSFSRIIYYRYLTNFNIGRCILDCFFKFVHLVFCNDSTGLDILFESLIFIIDIIIIWFIIISHKEYLLLTIDINSNHAIIRMFNSGGLFFTLFKLSSLNSYSALFYSETT